MTEFEDAYFATFYRNSEHRNSASKLRWYESQVRRWHTDRPVRLLDVGCGLGAFAFHMSRSDDMTVTASDVSIHAIDRNRKTAAQVAWVHAGADQQIAPPGSFDVITALDVLEHLPDPAAALETFATMLSDEGTLFVVVPVYDGITGPIIRLLDKDPTHVNKWSRREWLDTVGERFQLRHWAGIVRYPLPFGYLHLGHRWIRRFSPAMLIVAVKPGPL